MLWPGLYSLWGGGKGGPREGHKNAECGGPGKRAGGGGPLISLAVQQSRNEGRCV